MYPISNAAKALFEAGQRQVLRITGTDGNGNAISITEANVMMGGFNIDRTCINGNRIEIGTAIASELTLKLDNRNGQFNSVKFEGAELFVEIGIADWTQANPTVTYIPCGYFTPDEQPRSFSIITLHALDRMMRFDAVPPTLTPWTNESGEIITDNNDNVIYFLADLVFPTTVSDLINQVCLRCFVPFSQSLTSFPNYNYAIDSLPVLQQEITFRNIIQWCAGIMGTNAWIDWTGSLQFSWYGSTSVYTTTTANRVNSDLFEDDITLTGVQYTNTQNVSVISGTPEYALDMTGNYLAASGISTILPAVKNVINGFTYRPFSASLIVDAPYLWPMDAITFTDRDENNHTSVLTNVNFGINGTTELAGKGQTAQTNKGTAPSGMTPEQAFMIEKAAEATKELDESLDQEGIFNRLTDNGEVQGLYLYDGKLYINADYIRSGTIVANYIKGGTLTLGGANNTNGQMNIVNANGIVVGGVNNNGFYISNDGLTRKIEINAGAITAYDYKEFLGSFVRTLSIDTDNGINRIRSTNGLYLCGTDIGSLTYINLGDGIYHGTKIDIVASYSGGGSGAVYIQYNQIQLYVNGHYATFDGVNGFSAKLSATNGASGTFTTADGKTVTVTNGIITEIV